MEQTLKILIVEDDEVDRSMVRSALGASGLDAQLTDASGGVEGVRLLTTERFDCALIDHQLSDLDGLSVLREARQRGCNTPIIMLTGQGDEQLAVEIMKAGANDYLSKARISRDLLSHAVRHVVRLQRAQSEAQAATARGAESEQRFRNMADSAPVLLWVTDEQMMCTYLNQVWLTFTGQSSEQGLGRGWAEAVHVEDRPRAFAACEAAFRERKRFDVEYRLRRADGEWRWMFSSGAPRLLADGSLAGYIGSCIDITERKLAEKDRAELLSREQAARAAAEASEQRYRHLAEDMKQLKDAAEAANAAKDRFLSVLSHELRTPLTPVLSTVQWLETDPALGAEVKAALEMVRRNVELEARLIDDLLDLTRINKGKLEMVLGTVNVHDCVQNVLASYRGELAGKGLALRVDLSPDSEWALADAARVQQVFWNLLSNALKFTPEGGSVDVSTRLVQAPEFRRVLLEVQDSGIGIDPEVLPRIFDAFEQGERAITRQFGGLGLGLSISRSLMQMQGGTLTGHSDGKGKGAVFRAEFVAAAVPRDAMPEIAPPVSSETEGKSLRILLVDDHEDTARAMGRLLKGLGHAVTLADSVGGALGEFAARPFDLLISDIGLPDGSGLDLIRQIRQNHAVRGIALSGFGMEEDLQKSKDAGFSRHLTKPINFQKLELAIKEVTEEGSN